KPTLDNDLLWITKLITTHDKFSEDENVERSFANWGMAYYPIDAETTSKSEFEQFKRNLLLLADLTTPKNLTAKLFWERIKILIADPPNHG
ncbi:hypothetical protein K1F50_17285, partial [Muricauda oceani]|uniref:hypothetical protein n=1 Tax=Flagellimonas oceani TaxID=2698672 RepID=UPI001C667C56